MEVRPGYKQTDPGVTPEDWEVKPLEDVFSLKHGFAFSSNYFSNAGPVVLTPGNFRLEGGLYFEDRNTKRYSGIYSPKMTFSRGDLLIVMTDLTPDCNLLGKPAFVENDEVILHNQRIGKVVFKDTSAEPHFLFYLLLSTHYLSRIREQATGSTVRHTSNKSIYSIQLAWPLPSEQRAIAEALTDVDALLAALDRLIAKKRDLKLATMQQLLIGKKRLPGFQGEWETLNLSEDSTLKARIGWQGLTTAEYLKSGEYYLVTGTDFTNGRIAWSGCCFVAHERYTQDRNIQLRPKDILLTKDGTIGKVGFIDHLPGPATLNSGVFVIRPKDVAYEPKFLYYVLTSRIFDEFLVKLQAGSTIFHLYQKDFVSFSFLAPATISEQIAIAEVLSDMDAELAALEQRRKKTRALKQGMMQELLTGRVRLVATPKPAHNWQINEAVIIGALTLQFGTEERPLPRKRRVKLTYLLHRHAEGKAEGFLKKAAGPYNPKIKYQGPEAIALKNGYVREHNNGTYVGFLAGERIAQAEQYFAEWYPGAKEWLEQFHFEKTDELELLTTVDMAMEDLRKSNRAVNLKAVKEVICTHPEWEAKLGRSVFSDSNIKRAINLCSNLFAL